MKQIRIFMLFALTIGTINAVDAQTVDAVISKYIATIGGKDKLAQDSTLYMEATSSIMGNDVPVVVSLVNGKAYKSVTNFNGQKIVRCYTDKGGWTINPYSGSDGAVPLPQHDFNAIKGDIYIGGALYNYAVNHIGNAQLQGTVDGAYKIQLSAADSVVTTYYLDTATNYLMKMVRPGEFQGQQVDVTTTFSDYKDAGDGLIMPYSSNIDFGGNFSMATTLNKVEINKSIDPAIFEMPK